MLLGEFAFEGAAYNSTSSWLHLFRKAYCSIHHSGTILLASVTLPGMGHTKQGSKISLYQTWKRSLWVLKLPLLKALFPYDVILLNQGRERN